MKIKKVDYCTPYQIILIKKIDEEYRLNIWHFANEKDMYRASRVLHYFKPRWLVNYRINIEE